MNIGAMMAAQAAMQIAVRTMLNQQKKRREEEEEHKKESEEKSGDHE